MPGRIIDGYRFFFYSNFGTLTFQAEPSKLARIAVVGFRDNDVILTLTDGRAIHLDMAKYANQFLPDRGLLAPGARTDWSRRDRRGPFQEGISRQ